MRHHFHGTIGINEAGSAEEFSWDLLPVVDPATTAHLSEVGVPHLGTIVGPGMTVIGKIAKSRLYDLGRKPTCFELHSLPFDELRRQFGHLWVDTSVYVPAGIEGRVVDARVEGETAVVVVEQLVSREPSGSYLVRRDE